MADRVIDSERILKYLGLWGQPVVSKQVPTGGFTGASHHNVVARQAQIGEVRAVYCDGSVGQPGWSTFIYLKVGTQNADVAIAAKTVCVPDSATVWYEVTNDPDSCVNKNSALSVVALGAMTNAYYGWFWEGGVCPEQYVTTLGGTYPTDDSVVAGSFRVGDLTADAMGFVSAQDLPSGTAAVTTLAGATGYSLAADVTSY
ncbi:MAG: hypothetical protein FD189_1104 [Elusimicrobia bacterium]|nr:MAG: hypothetical protein FD189_1104 [Elusimicrobiota bacterium]